MELNCNYGCSIGWFRSLAENLSAESGLSFMFEENRVILPPEIGSGTWSFIELEEGLSVIIVDAQYSTEVTYNPVPTAKGEHYILYYSRCNIRISNGEDEWLACNYVIGSSSLKGMSCTPPVNENNIAVIIVASRKWVQENMKQYISSLKKSLVKDFISDRPLCIAESLNEECTKLVTEILEEHFAGCFSKFYIHGNVLKLIALFGRGAMLPGTEKELFRQESDLTVMLKVRDFLISDFEKGYPCINELARMAHMGTTKFKKLFRNFFGRSCFEYYQVMRMERAMELLKAGVPVSQVGYKVGYHNLGHFAAMFKRHYNVFPRDVSAECRIQQQCELATGILVPVADKHEGPPGPKELKGSLGSSFSAFLDITRN